MPCGTGRTTPPRRPNRRAPLTLRPKMGQFQRSSQWNRVIPCVGVRSMRQPGEPSVEEILESIKKVIARDNRTDADEARQPRDAVNAASPRPADEPALDIPAGGSAAGILELSDASDYAHEALE